MDRDRFDPIKQEARADFVADVRRIVEQHAIEERDIDTAIGVMFEGIPEEPGSYDTPGIPAHVCVSDVTIFGQHFHAHRPPTFQEWRALICEIAKMIEREG